MQAVQKGDLKQVKRLLKQGADVSQLDFEGKSALFYIEPAAEKAADQVKILQLLLEKGTPKVWQQVKCKVKCIPNDNVWKESYQVNTHISKYLLCFACPLDFTKLLPWLVEGRNYWDILHLYFQVGKSTSKYPLISDYSDIPSKMLNACSLAGNLDWKEEKGKVLIRWIISQKLFMLNKNIVEFLLLEDGRCKASDFEQQIRHIYSDQLELCATDKMVYVTSFLLQKGMCLDNVSLKMLTMPSLNKGNIEELLSLFIQQKVRFNFKPVSNTLQPILEKGTWIQALWYVKVMAHIDNMGWLRGKKEEKTIILYTNTAMSKLKS